MSNLDPDPDADSPAVQDPATPAPPSAVTQSPTTAATHASVAAAVQQLDGLAELQLAEHPDVYEHIHSELQRALADIDDA